MFAKMYGWTIEYIMGLTKPQIDALLQGIEKLNKEAKKSEGSGSGKYTSKYSMPDSNGKNLDSEEGDDNAKMAIFSFPGMKLSDKAKKKLDKVMKRKFEKNKKEKKDA